MASINQYFPESPDDLGELSPGWSINSFATPHVIGESAGGTGSVNTQYSAREDSLFVISDNAQTSYSDGFYTKYYNGIVKSVSQAGNNISISQATQLDKYDADYNIPQLTNGGIAPVVDIASILVGDSGLNPYGLNVDGNAAPFPGHATSLCGHSNFYDAEHNRVIGESKTTTYNYYNPATGKDETINVEYLRNAIWADDYVQASNLYIYANGVTGDSFSPINSEANVEHIAYKFVFEEELDIDGIPTGNLIGHTWGFSGNPIYAGSDYGFQCNIVMSPSTSELIAGFDCPGSRNIMRAESFGWKNHLWAETATESALSMPSSK